MSIHDPLALSKSINSMIRESPSTTLNPSIYRVIDFLRSTREKAYEPMVVSIGPFHRGKLHLKAMEQLKVRYLKQLVGESSVDSCVEAVRGVAKAARACYAEHTGLGDDSFVEMLLLDGAFIVEFLREYKLYKGGSPQGEGPAPFFGCGNFVRGVAKAARACYAEHTGLGDDSFVEMLLLDGAFIVEFLREYKLYKGGSPQGEGPAPFFGCGNFVCYIRRDLMLFENQIPLFVLQQLFDLSKIPGDKKKLNDLMCPSLSKTPVPESGVDDHHLLGLVHRARCLYFVRETSTPSSDSRIENIRCATELKEAGIVFNNSSTNWLNIRFKNKILDIHQLEISDSTESLFLNMIAYEFYLQSNSPKYFSDYAYFLQCLIHSSKDSELLRGCGVISNLLGGDARVYELIGRLGANVQISENFLYSDVFRSVNRYCRHRRNRWIAMLRRKHFSNPWTSISLAAAAVLLSVGMVQMVYAVLSFYSHP